MLLSQYQALFTQRFKICFVSKDKWSSIVSRNHQLFATVTLWEQMISKLDYYEKVYEDKLQAQMLESDSEDDLKPKAVFTINSSTFTMPCVVSDW